jgi:hypothetical protein
MGLATRAHGLSDFGHLHSRPDPQLVRLDLLNTTMPESSLVGFGGLDDNLIKGLTCVLSVE